MKYQNNRAIKIIFILFALLVLSCSQENRYRAVKNLNISMTPGQNEKFLRAKIQPLASYIQQRTGIKTTIKVPDSYEQLIDWFKDQQVDLVLFGGATYIKAHQISGALPLVMRDIDTKFRSVALTQIENPANSLQDLKGSSVAFGSPLSTSGHFMPRYFFQSENINAEEFFSTIEYSGAHDVTANWVQDGKVDVGLANYSIIKEMFLDKRLSKEKVKIIWESPFYADYVWAIQADIDKKQITSIRDSFLQLSSDQSNKDLLRNLGANYYIPASHDDFKNLEEIIIRFDKNKPTK